MWSIYWLDDQGRSISRIKARPGSKLAPDKSSPRLKARFYLYYTTTKETYKMTNEEAIRKALAELELSLKLNYTKITKKYKIG
jgi:hypothetical protein